MVTTRLNQRFWEELGASGFMVQDTVHKKIATPEKTLLYYIDYDPKKGIRKVCMLHLASQVHTQTQHL